VKRLAAVWSTIGGMHDTTAITVSATEFVRMSRSLLRCDLHSISILSLYRAVTGGLCTARSPQSRSLEARLSCFSSIVLFLCLPRWQRWRGLKSEVIKRLALFGCHRGVIDTRQRSLCATRSFRCMSRSPSEAHSISPLFVAYRSRHWRCMRDRSSCTSRSPSEVISISLYFIALLRCHWRFMRDS
jgi:hypothetical protein